MERKVYEWMVKKAKAALNCEKYDDQEMMIRVCGMNEQYNK